MTSSSTYVRTSFTWLAYLMVGYFSSIESMLGPTLPLLQQQLGLSYTVVSLHFTAFALGIILTGIAGDRVIGRWGRRATLWSGAAGMVIGEMLIAVGRNGSLASDLFLGSVSKHVLREAKADVLVVANAPRA